MGQIPLANGFYQSESLPLSNQRCINAYPHINEAPALSEQSLIGCGGLTQLTTTGVGEVNRGAWSKNGIPYFVNGTSLYRVTRSVAPDGTETFTATDVGTVAGTGRVWMRNNPTQLMILNTDGAGYIYNEDDGTPFQQITDSNFTGQGTPRALEFIDGYFVVTTDNKIVHSNLNDGLTYNALDYGDAESDPDGIVAPVVVQNQLYIIGEYTTEGFSNVGGSGFVFQRNNVFIDKGCVAPFSVINANQTFFMIGKTKQETPTVWMFTGSDYKRVSTSAIEDILMSVTDTELADAHAIYYGTNGHYFVNFKFGPHTVAYDLVTQRWHERQSYEDEGYFNWRVSSITEAYGRIMVADTQDGRIGEIDKDVYAEYSNILPVEFSLQPFYSNKGLALPALELTMESGVGNDDVVDPQVSLQISKDGKTFGSERKRSIGKKGEYNRRIVWRRNGRADRFAVLKFKMTDKANRVFIRLDAD